jgi:hypothetical protein
MYKIRIEKKHFRRLLILFCCEVVLALASKVVEKCYNYNTSVTKTRKYYVNIING